MSKTLSTHPLGADYSDIAACLFAIQSRSDNGTFDLNAQRLLNNLVGAHIKKLYIITLWAYANWKGLAAVTNENILTGDFSFDDYNFADFNEALIVWDDKRSTDFLALDFSFVSFTTELLDTTNNGFSSQFQTILNTFTVLRDNLDYIYAPFGDSVDFALRTELIKTLDAFSELKSYLIATGQNPCVTAAPFKNTESLYLQAAGSNGSDGSLPGIHLRWSLAGELGENHLPQGNYYGSAVGLNGYNKPNDYVLISRTVHDSPVIITLDLVNTIPTYIYSAPYDYATLVYAHNQTVNDKPVRNLVKVKLLDKQLVQRMAFSNSIPDLSPDYLNAYLTGGGIAEITVDGKEAFAFGYDMIDDSQMRVEIISSPAETTSVRKFADAKSGRILADNMTKVRLLADGSSFAGISQLTFETYDDFTSTRKPDDWITVGNNFGLTLQDNVVFDRLEHIPGSIDHQWPLYKSGTYVKIANYQDKWSISRENEPSIKDAVTQYLALSQTDSKALIKIEDADSQDVEGYDGFSVSYLDILNLIAVDFHWARMFGLGHIDRLEDTLKSPAYIYKATYVNRRSLADPTPVIYEYLSLPTSRDDDRLPERPSLNQLAYTKVGLTDKLFDSNGYSLVDNTRLISISRKAYDYERTDVNFLVRNSPDIMNFNIYEQSIPVLYNLEYRTKAAGKGNYVRPGITTAGSPGYPYYAYDDDHPSTGVLEPVPVTDDSNGLFTHFEKQPGVHFYAVFSINWFSRSSVTSAERATDNTIFTPRNTLQPPQNIAVQYIQEEDPLIFTSAREQGWLSGRKQHFPNLDVNFTRVTFDWLDIIDLSNVYDVNQPLKADVVRVWFKEDPLMQLQGVIANITTASFNNYPIFHTAGYDLILGSILQPSLPAEYNNRFVGSSMTTEVGNFTVRSINPGAPLAIAVEKSIKREVVGSDDSDNPETKGVAETELLPHLGTRFTVTENLSRQDNWSFVEATITLIDQAVAPVIESATDEFGNVSGYLVGGIYAPATVEQLYSAEEVSELMPGYYSVTFEPGVVLRPHPQSNPPYDPSNPHANSPTQFHEPFVEWYNGLVRLPVAGGTDHKKLVNVIRIVETNPLKLYIFDPAFETDPIIISTHSADFIDGVNYHPGYRAYLLPEPGLNFNGLHILPGPDENEKQTLLGLQAFDRQTGYTSAVSPPSILLARLLESPVAPETPFIRNLRVRPDATTKAALTFDVKIGSTLLNAQRQPYGMMFYRTSADDVLEALYQQSTIELIRTELAALTNDEFFEVRYRGLVNLETDPADQTQFIQYGSYRFPTPDKTDSHVVANYREAILSTLLPLTVQTPVLSLVKTGAQTENKTPVIKDIDGNLLDPSNPSFDPFPMVRKPDATKLRFTDYTLNGASRFLYFYAAAESTNQLKIGPLSGFAGPVTIVDTLPPLAPVVGRVSIGLDKPAVTFRLSPFLAGDTITHVKIYRSFDSSMTGTLLEMPSQLLIETAFDLNNELVITDDFRDFDRPPLGRILYYRLAFIRTVINERNELEQITGHGSDVIKVTLIDIVNPEAPQVYLQGSDTLVWLPTTYGGTYYLYQQSSNGNWQKLKTFEPAESTGTMQYQIVPPPAPPDPAGNNIYLRFKVKAQNSNGLLNLVDNILTI